MPSTPLRHSTKPTAKSCGRLAAILVAICAHASAQTRDAGLTPATAPATASDAGVATAAPLEATATSPAPWGTPPFDAWVQADSVVVIPSSTRQWPSLGIVGLGDTVRVVSCEPSCTDTGGWANLAPFGAIRLRYLRPMPRSDASVASAPDAEFRFARVTGTSVVSRVAPDDTAQVVRRFNTGDEIVFRPAPQDGADGAYLIRPDGTYVRTRDVRFFVLSTLEGWHNPAARFAIAREATTLTQDDGTVRQVAQYEHFAYLGQGSGRVRVEGGSLPWRSVRLGRARTRSFRVPATARWVHVDLRQQVLTAYEGDRLVFATLISAGLHERTTQSGNFRVVRKALYTTMKASATESDSYYVEGVQWTQFFHDSVALHTAFWHDRFGTPMSHGCVNLSPHDARWLFEWGPGEVPQGWRVVNPLAAGMESLYVRVERASP